MKDKVVRLVFGIIVLALVSAWPARTSAQTVNTPEPARQSAEQAPVSNPLPSPKTGHAKELEKKLTPLPSLGTVFASLLLVLGVFFALVWALRRASPAGAALLPVEAFEVLGRAPLANRQQAHLLRCGNKLLLISTSAAGVEPLTEIADAAEVDRLTTLCRQSRPTAATTALRDIFRQKGKGDA